MNTNTSLKSNLVTALVFSTVLILSGCQTPAPPAKPAPPTQPAQPAQPTITPFVSVTKHYSGVGVVTKINLELGSVGLDHEEIKGLMPAMSMEYYVKDKAILKTVKVGQTVDFTVEDVSGAENISALTPRAPTKK